MLLNSVPGGTNMNEIVHVIWFVANALILVTAIGITVSNIVSDIRATREANELSEASSFMNMS